MKKLIYSSAFLILALFACNNSQTNSPNSTKQEVIPVQVEKKETKIDTCGIDFNKLFEPNFVKNNLNRIVKFEEGCLFDVLETLSQKAIETKNIKYLSDLELILSKIDKDEPYETAADQASFQFVKNFDCLTQFFISHKNSSLEKTVITNFAYDFGYGEQSESVKVIYEVIKDNDLSKENYKKIWDNIISKAKIEKDNYK